jgi:hypothetical protein
MSTKFLLLSSQRTGSAFLEQCLNSHEEIKCRGEVLLGYGGDYKKLPPRFLKKYRRTRTLWQSICSGALIDPMNCIDSHLTIPNGYSAAGFRLMYNQIERDFRVKRHLEQISDVKIVLLQRKNILKQFVSLKLMHNQSKYGRFSAHVFEKQNIIKVRINPSEAIEYMNKIHLQKERYRKFFANLEMLEINYEDMIGTGGLNETSSASLCSFLDVKKTPLISKQVKMNPSNLQDIIINYDELMNAVEKYNLSGIINE